MIKSCVIVDDEYLAIRILKKYIIERKDIKCVNSFVNPLEAIDYINQNPIDIAFVDIQMSISGLKLKEQIPKSTIVVFTTANPNYAIEALNMNAADYILKPVSFDRFNQATDRAIAILNSQLMSNKDQKEYQKKIIIIKSNKTIHKVVATELLYIESLSEYLCYYTLNNKILALGALRDIIDTLPQGDFIRIHRSFIINKNAISCYNSTDVTLKNGQKLTVGRVYKQEFKNALNNNF